MKGSTVTIFIAVASAGLSCVGLTNWISVYVSGKSVEGMSVPDPAETGDSLYHNDDSR